MHPILFKFGPVTIYSYGAMFALGSGIAAFLIYRRAPRFCIDRNRAVDITILTLIGGIFGSRLLYIILNLSYYMQNPMEALYLSRGGLVWYGGFASAIIFIILYIKRNKLDFWNVTDLLVPYVALAQGFGRIGCFFNGCCYGIEIPPGERIPAQLYSAAALFIIFVVLRLWQERRRFNGEIFLGYCALYSMKRFMAEFLRGDNPKTAFGLTFSQLISVAVLLASAAVFIYRTAEWKKRSSDLK